MNPRIALSVLFLFSALAYCQETRPAAHLPSEGKVDPWTHLNFANSTDEFQFAIVSDRAGGRRPGVFAKAVEKLNLLRPEFVISIGDLIDGSYDPLEADRQWEEFDGIVNKLDMPFFYVAGNHDLGIAGKWEERLGRKNYHFVYGNVLFLVLDLDPQAEYVSRALTENPDVRWTFVFTHAPLWTWTRKHAGWEKIEELLKGRKCTVFAGHVHRYMKYLRNDQKYFTLATTGGGSELEGPHFGTFDHIVWVTMAADGPKIANLMLDGIHDENVRTEESAKAVEGIFRNSGVFAAPPFINEDKFAGGTAPARLANDADYPMQVLAMFRAGSEIQAEPVLIDRTIPPRSKEDISIDYRCGQPMDLADVTPLKLEWTIRYEMPEFPGLSRTESVLISPVRLLTCPSTTAPIVVDGRLDEWPSLPHACLKPGGIFWGPDKWDGPDDCSFQFSVVHDEKFLYVAIKTNDNEQILDPTSTPWRQDSIELWLDARPPQYASQNTRRQSDACLILNICPGKTPQEPLFPRADRRPAGTQGACISDGGGLVAEFAIPVSYLDQMQGGPWKTFRLNVAVQDRDIDPRERTTIYWQRHWDQTWGGASLGSGTFAR